MRRREFISALGSEAAPGLWPTGAHAQLPDRVRRIGILISPEDRGLAKEFWRRLETLGWADGRNFRADSRLIEINRIGEVAKEIVQQRPEVIVAGSTVTV